MTDLPINTAACAHAHLTPILDLVKAEYPNVATQISPDESGHFVHPTTQIVFTIDEDEYGLTIRAKTDTKGYGRNQTISIAGYSITKGRGIMHHVGENRPLVLRKDGTFDYVEAADLVIRAHRAALQGRASLAQREANKTATEALLPQIKAASLPGINVSVTDRKDHPLEVSINIRVQCGAEEAHDLVSRIGDWHHNGRA